MIEPRLYIYTGRAKSFETVKKLNNLCIQDPKIKMNSDGQKHARDAKRPVKFKRI